MYLLSNIDRYSQSERFLCINVLVQITSANVKYHSGSDLVACLQSLHNVFNTTSATYLLLLFWCSLQQTVSAQNIYTCRIFEKVIWPRPDLNIKFRNIFLHTQDLQFTNFYSRNIRVVCVVAARGTTNCTSCIGQMTGSLT